MVNNNNNRNIPFNNRMTNEGPRGSGGGQNPWEEEYGWDAMRFSRKVDGDEGDDESAQLRRKRGAQDTARGKSKRWGMWNGPQSMMYPEPLSTYPGGWWDPEYIQNWMSPQMRYRRGLHGARAKRDTGEEDDRSKRWMPSSWNSMYSSWGRNPYFWNDNWMSNDNQWWNNDDEWNYQRYPREGEKKDGVSRSKRDTNSEGDRLKRWQSYNWNPWMHNWQTNPYGWSNNWWGNNDMWNGMRYSRGTDKEDSGNRQKRDAANAVDGRSKRWQGYNWNPWMYYTQMNPYMWNNNLYGNHNMWNGMRNPRGTEENDGKDRQKRDIEAADERSKRWMENGWQPWASKWDQSPNAWGSDWWRNYETWNYMRFPREVKVEDDIRRTKRDANSPETKSKRWMVNSYYPWFEDWQWNYWDGMSKGNWWGNNNNMWNYMRTARGADGGETQSRAKRDAQENDGTAKRWAGSDRNPYFNDWGWFPNNWNDNWWGNNGNVWVSTRFARNSDHNKNSRAKREASDEDSRSKRWMGASSNSWSNNWPWNSNNWNNRWMPRGNYWTNDYNSWNYMRHPRSEDGAEGERAKRNTNKADENRAKRWMGNNWYPSASNWQWGPHTMQNSWMYGMGQWDNMWNSMRYPRQSQKQEKGNGHARTRRDITDRSKRWYGWNPWMSSWQGNYFDWNNNNDNWMSRNNWWGSDGMWNSMRYPRKSEEQDEGDQSRTRRDTNDAAGDRSKRWYSWYPNNWQLNPYGWNNWMSGNSWWGNDNRYPRQSERQDGEEIEQHRTRRDASDSAGERSKRWYNWYPYNWQQNPYGWSNWMTGNNRWGNDNMWSYMRYARESEGQAGEETEQSRAKRNVGNDAEDRSKRWYNWYPYNQQWNPYGRNNYNNNGMFRNNWWKNDNMMNYMRYPRDSEGQSKESEKPRVKRDANEDDDRSKRWYNWYPDNFQWYPYGWSSYNSNSMFRNNWWGGDNMMNYMRYPRESEVQDKETEHSRDKRDANADAERSKRWYNWNPSSWQWNPYGWNNYNSNSMFRNNWWEGNNMMDYMRYPRESKEQDKANEQSREKRDVKTDADRSKRWYNWYPSNFQWNLWNNYNSNGMFRNNWWGNYNMMNYMRYPRESHGQDEETEQSREKRDTNVDADRSKRWYNWYPSAWQWNPYGWNNYNSNGMFRTNWRGTDDMMNYMRYSRESDGQDEDEQHRNRRDANADRSKRWYNWYPYNWQGYPHGWNRYNNNWMSGNNWWGNDMSYIRYPRDSEIQTEEAGQSREKRDTVDAEGDRSKRWDNWYPNNWQWNPYGSMFGNNWWGDGNMWNDMRYPRQTGMQTEDTEQNKEKRDTNDAGDRSKRWNDWYPNTWQRAPYGWSGSNSWMPRYSGWGDGNSWNYMRHPRESEKQGEDNDHSRTRRDTEDRDKRWMSNRWYPWYGNNWQQPQWHPYWNNGWMSNMWNSMRFSRESKGKNDEERSKRDTNVDAERSKRWMGNAWYPMQWSYPNWNYYWNIYNWQDNQWDNDNMWDSGRQLRQAGDEGQERKKRDAENDADRSKRWMGNNWYPWQWQQWNPYQWNNNRMPTGRWWNNNMWSSMRYQRETEIKRAKRDTGSTDGERPRRWMGNAWQPWSSSWQRNPYTGNNNWMASGRWWNNNNNDMWNYFNQRGVRETEQYTQSRAKRESSDDDRSKRWMGSSWYQWPSRWQGSQWDSQYMNNPWMSNWGNNWYQMRYPRESKQEDDKLRTKRDTENADSRSKRWQSQSWSPQFYYNRQRPQWSPYSGGNNWEKNWMSGENWPFPINRQWNSMRYERESEKSEGQDRNKRSANIDTKVENDNRGKRWENFYSSPNNQQWQSRWYEQDNWNNDFMSRNSMPYPDSWRGYSSWRYPRSQDGTMQTKRSAQDNQERVKRWQGSSSFPWSQNRRQWQPSPQTYMANVSPWNNMGFSNRRNNWDYKNMNWDRINDYRSWRSTRDSVGTKMSSETRQKRNAEEQNRDKRWDIWNNQNSQINWNPWWYYSQMSYWSPVDNNMHRYSFNRFPRKSEDNENAQQSHTNMAKRDTETASRPKRFNNWNYQPSWFNGNYPIMWNNGWNQTPMMYNGNTWVIPYIRSWYWWFLRSQGTTPMMSVLSFNSLRTARKAEESKDSSTGDEDQQRVKRDAAVNPDNREERWNNMDFGSRFGSDWEGRRNNPESYSSSPSSSAFGYPESYNSWSSLNRYPGFGNGNSPRARNFMRTPNNRNFGLYRYMRNPRQTDSTDKEDASRMKRESDADSKSDDVSDSRDKRWSRGAMNMNSGNFPNNQMFGWASSRPQKWTPQGYGQSWTPWMARGFGGARPQYGQ